MATSPIRPWIEVAALHPDVLSEGFSEDIFALDLGPLAEGRPGVPTVYKDPERIFASSYLTVGLRSLLEDVRSGATNGHGPYRQASRCAKTGRADSWNRSRAIV